MEWLFLGIGIIVSTELFLRLPLGRSLYVLKETGHKAIYSISSSKISDHWKEIVLPRYALRIFTTSLCMFMFIVLALIPFGIMLFISERNGFTVMDLAVSVEGIVFSTVVCLVYIAARRKLD